MMRGDYISTSSNAVYVCSCSSCSSCVLFLDHILTLLRIELPCSRHGGRTHSVTDEDDHIFGVSRHLLGHQVQALLQVVLASRQPILHIW